MKDQQHRCPAPECPERIPHEKLFCKRHWFLVPPAIRKAVNDAYHRGIGELRKAQRKAIQAVRDLIHAEKRAQAASDDADLEMNLPMGEDFGDR
jgi:hypothetical protein